MFGVCKSVIFYKAEVERVPEVGAGPLQGPGAANRWWLYQILSLMDNSIILICYLAFFKRLVSFYFSLSGSDTPFTYFKELRRYIGSYLPYFD